MKVNLLSSDIYEVEDFITDKEQKEVLSYAKSLQESDWWSDDVRVPAFFNGKINIGQKPEVFLQIDEKIKSLFSNFYAINPASLHRHLKTNYMLPHKDYDPKNESEDYDPEKKSVGQPMKPKYGLVLYYNDDYEGGAINYPDLGLVHKPKAKSLILHGGNILHGTTQVTSDAVRYFSTTFIMATKEVPVHLNTDVFGDNQQSDQYTFF
jgi:hypothetical protein